MVTVLWNFNCALITFLCQANMADHMRWHRVRWLGHAARKPNDVMVKQLLFAHSIPGHPQAHGAHPPHVDGHRHA